MTGIAAALMDIHLPDPAFTQSARSRANFRLALRLAFAFVGLIWLIHLSSWALGLDSGWMGVRPREWLGLAGVLFAPLVHGSFDHLIANSVPIVVLGTTMLYLYPRASPIVLPAVYFGPGIAVWLFAAGGVHVGASGIAFGLVSYIFFAGMIRRDRRAIAASMLVAFLYGALIWDVLPIRAGMSWETHLAAAAIGLVLAIALRRRDIPPRRRYSWEDEPQQPAEWDGEWVVVQDPPRAPVPTETRPTLH